MKQAKKLERYLEILFYIFAIISLILAYQVKVLKEDNYILNQKNELLSDSHSINNQLKIYDESIGQSAQNQKSREQISIEEEWNFHLDRLNKDQDRIYNGPFFEKGMSTVELNTVGSRLGAKIGIYELHLSEARNFLDGQGSSLNNRNELKNWIDDQIVSIESFKNSINAMITTYNSLI